MVETTPIANYRNAMVLYHWKQCGHCKTFAPTFKAIVPQLPQGTAVYSIEVAEQRNKLQELGVDLDNGVPRIVFYNNAGEEYVYDKDERELEPVLSAGKLHLMSVSPSDIAPPSVVMYFSHECGFCVRFAPTFVQLPDAVDSVGVVSVDVQQYPEALRGLEEQAQSGGVPHVVFHPISGPQVPFKEDRTLVNLKSFVNAKLALEGGGEETARAVRFSDKQRTAMRAHLSAGLDDLQDLAIEKLGPEYRKLFEPDEAGVCFVGWCCKSHPSKDRMIVMLIPQGDRALNQDGEYPVFAVLHGGRRGNVSAKIYEHKNPKTFLQQKHRSGFRKAQQTDVLVQELRDMGYKVRVDVGKTVCIFD